MTDSGLQPERTALAWRRTILTLVASAFVSARVLPELLGVGAIIPASVGALGSLALIVAARGRYNVPRMPIARHGRTTGAPRDGAILAGVATLMVAAGGIAATAVLLG